MFHNWTSYNRVTLMFFYLILYKQENQWRQHQLIFHSQSCVQNVQNICWRFCQEIIGLIAYLWMGTSVIHFSSAVLNLLASRANREAVSSLNSNRFGSLGFYWLIKANGGTSKACWRFSALILAGRLISEQKTWWAKVSGFNLFWHLWTNNWSKV